MKLSKAAFKAVSKDTNVSAVAKHSQAERLAPRIGGVVGGQSNRSHIMRQPYYQTKSKGVAFVLCIFLGYLGVHRFYAGKTFSGVLYLFTGGLVGFGWLYDIFAIATDRFMPVVSHHSPMMQSPSFPKYQTPASSVNQTPASPEESLYEHITFKVKGVTFNNEDGTDRQHILKMLDLEKQAGKSEVLFEIERTQYEGKPAFAIYANEKRIGNVPAELCEYLNANYDRIIGFSYSKLLGGKVYKEVSNEDEYTDYEETGQELTYGVELTLRLNKVS